MNLYVENWFDSEIAGKSQSTLITEAFVREYNDFKRMMDVIDYCNESEVLIIAVDEDAVIEKLKKVWGHFKEVIKTRINKIIHWIGSKTSEKTIDKITNDVKEVDDFFKEIPEYELKDTENPVVIPVIVVEDVSNKKENYYYSPEELCNQILPDIQSKFSEVIKAASDFDVAIKNEDEQYLRDYAENLIKASDDFENSAGRNLKIYVSSSTRPEDKVDLSSTNPIEFKRFMKRAKEKFEDIKNNTCEKNYLSLNVNTRAGELLEIMGRIDILINQTQTNQSKYQDIGLLVQKINKIALEWERKLENFVRLQNQLIKEVVIVNERLIDFKNMQKNKEKENSTEVKGS